jgi:hypothetical protein
MWSLYSLSFHIPYSQLKVVSVSVCIEMVVMIREIKRVGRWEMNGKS